MPKNGMKRPEATHKAKNEALPVPEIQGKAKSGKIKANMLIAGETDGKVYHSRPRSAERKIANSYGIIDTDLARDNMENDSPEADLKNLY